MPTSDNHVHRRVLSRVAQATTGLYCGKVIGEYLAKLTDLKHPPARAALFITYLVGAFERVEITTVQAPFRPEDLDDEIFILCAIDGDADYLITEDNQLLALTANYAPLTITACAGVAVCVGV